MTKKKDKPNEGHYIEATHVACIVQALVERELVEHPAIDYHPEFKALAEKASQALFDLYQAVGTYEPEK